MTSNPPNREEQNMNSRSQQDKQVSLPSQVYAQLEALRKSGAVNMYTEVHAGLEYFEFEEARQWLEANPEIYAEGITREFVPRDPDSVEKIDAEKLANSLSNESKISTRTDADTPNEQYILDHLESLQRISERAGVYYAEGHWRKIAPLSDRELELVDLFKTGVDCQPRQAYRNALLVAASFGRTHDVVYVEGYVMTSSFNVPLEHAWVELNGKVIELTLPRGPVPDSDAAYLGVEFSSEDARTKILDEGTAEPLVG
jgi:hypothetical protein